MVGKKLLGFPARGGKNFFRPLSESAAGSRRIVLRKINTTNQILNEAYASVTSVPRLSPVESWAQDL